MIHSSPGGGVEFYGLFIIYIARLSIVVLGCRSITSLSSLNSFDCLLAFDSSPFALAQVVRVSPECGLYIFLKIFSEFLDFSFQRLFLRAGHPLFTSLSIRKKPCCRASRNLFERQFFF